MADGWLLMVAALLGELVALEPKVAGPRRRVIAEVERTHGKP